MISLLQTRQKRIKRLESMSIHCGSHSTFKAGHCAMELVSWLAEEPHGSRPSCVCPVITMFVNRINDRIPTVEMRTQLLRPILPRLVNSRSDSNVEARRSYIVADAAVRIFAPIALDAHGLDDWAQTLRNLPVVEDVATAMWAEAWSMAAAADASYDASCAAYAAAAAASYAKATYADTCWAAAASASHAARATPRAQARVYSEALRVIEQMLAVSI